ncbi:MAG: class I SAM-dependent methyltransferase [Bacteroidota bacterium]
MTTSASNQNLNTREVWEKEFEADGFWEKTSGREQTRMFAKRFHRHIKVPLDGKFSILDVGCAVGDALPVWRKHYPMAELHGMDVSQRAIERATKEYGSIARFQQGGFNDITGHFDVMYCCNVLEHFENHVEIARTLLQHCSILYIMTPYAEVSVKGRQLSITHPEAMHVATFLDGTFDEMAQNEGAEVSVKVIRTPVAWGPSFPVEFLWHVHYMLGKIHAPSPPRRQIIYTLSRRNR